LPVIKRGPVTRTDSHEDRSPEDDKRRDPGVVLGNRSRAFWFPRLGRGKRNQREKRQEGMPAARSCPGLGERSNPLKGKPHERHLSETWQDGGGRKKSLRG
jgi:hypothetical protein